MDFMNSIFVGEIIKSYEENIILIDLQFSFIASEKLLFHSYRINIMMSFYKLLMFECT